MPQETIGEVDQAIEEVHDQAQHPSQKEGLSPRDTANSEPELSPFQKLKEPVNTIALLVSSYAVVKENELLQDEKVAQLYRAAIFSYFVLTTQE
jgi:hypothetical protein